MDIVLIPGFMLDADLWTDLRPDLARFGRLVDGDTTLDTSIARMATRILASMTEPAIVIGFSMGGYVAREILYQAPEKVAGLALIATSSRADSATRTAQRVSAAAGNSTFRRLSRSAVISSLHPDHRSDALIGRVQDMSERLGGDVLARQSQIHRDGDTQRLGEIACPTTIVAAAQDGLRSLAESEAMHAGIMGSTMTVIDHTGHLIPLEQPGRLVQALTPFLIGLTR